MPEPEALERSATELLQQLIRFDTVNPPGNEQALQNFLQDKLEAAGFDCVQLVGGRRPPEPGRAPAGPLRRPDALLTWATPTPCWPNPEDWTVDPWSGELRDGCVWGRGALDMKDQVACEVAAAIALAEEGWRPESGELMIVVTADEEAGATVGAKWLCESIPTSCAATTSSTRAAARCCDVDGRRVYGVCVAEKGVFRFTLTDARPRRARVDPAHRRQRADQAGADHRGARPRRPRRRCRCTRRSARDRRGARHRADGDADAALAELERLDPRLAVMLEPLMGVTFSPTMIRASREGQRDPGARAAEGRLPRAAGLGRGRTCARRVERDRRRRAAGRWRSTSRSSATARRSSRR